MSKESMFCMKCNERVTIHRSGICTQCRERKCKACNTTFIPMKPYTEMCVDCRYSKKRRESYKSNPILREEN